MLLLVVFTWLTLVWGADWLAHHDVGSARGTVHETALDNARGRLLTLAAGVLAAAALVFTALNFNLLRRTSDKTDQWQRRTYELAEQGLVTDRYTKAIEQLGSDKLDVRIGGIYALERIARDSARDHPTVMEVVAAFIREHSVEEWPPDGTTRKRSMRPDIQAAMRVIKRRDAGADSGPIDLGRANLTEARLQFANLGNSDLSGANLTGADLSAANLSGAHLNGADLTGADLTLAILTGADLIGANLSGATLSVADLRDADFTNADLSSAILKNANLIAAYLDSAIVTDADLTGASWTDSEPVPEGWTLEPDGRLGRASAESAPTQAN